MQALRKESGLSEPVVVYSATPSDTLPTSSDKKTPPAEADGAAEITLGAIGTALKASGQRIAQLPEAVCARLVNNSLPKNPRLCVEGLPNAPLDWKSPPLQFFAVEEEKPEHSTLILPPRG